MRDEAAWHRRIRNLKARLQDEGLLRTMGFYVDRIDAMFWNHRVFGRWDIYVATDARIGGVKYMKIGKRFSAGRGLWLEAIDRFGEGDHEQHFHPQLIIGDNVGLSEYVHIGCVNHIEIGNNVLMGSKIYITDHNHGVYKSSGGGHATRRIHRRMSVSSRSMSRSSSATMYGWASLSRSCPASP